ATPSGPPAHQAVTDSGPGLTAGSSRAHMMAGELSQPTQEGAVQIFVDNIAEISGQELDYGETLEASSRLNPTYEINEEVMQEMATISNEAEYTASDEIEGLVNTEFLDSILEDGE